MLLLLALTPIPAEALDPNIDVSQYAHAAWLVQDGYFNGTPGLLPKLPMAIFGSAPDLAYYDLTALDLHRGNFLAPRVYRLMRYFLCLARATEVFGLEPGQV